MQPLKLEACSNVSALESGYLRLFTVTPHGAESFNLKQGSNSEKIALQMANTFS